MEEPSSLGSANTGNTWAFRAAFHASMPASKQNKAPKQTRRTHHKPQHIRGNTSSNTTNHQSDRASAAHRPQGTCSKYQTSHQGDRVTTPRHLFTDIFFLLSCDAHLPAQQEAQTQEDQRGPVLCLLSLDGNRTSGSPEFRFKRLPFFLFWGGGGTCWNSFFLLGGGKGGFCWNVLRSLDSSCDLLPFAVCVPCNK